MTKQLVIVGTGAYAEVAAFYFEHDSPYTLAAFTVDGAYLRDASFQGKPVVPFETLAEAFSPADTTLFVAIGYHRLNHTRAEKVAQARQEGYSLASYISSKAATWPGLKTGDHCFVLEQVTLQPYVTLGHNVVVWSGSHIGHHSKIGDHCFITSQVVVSGNVSIGEYSFLGVNATVCDGLTVGRKNLIGAGALITNHTRDGAVFREKATAASAVDSQRAQKLLL